MKQISISIPDEWHQHLTHEARVKSIEENQTISHLDLIRRALIKEYKINQPIQINETKER